MKNYRSVSNLHFESETLEKLVVTRIEEHMSNNNLYMYDPLQSAYKSKHSTETVVLKIQNDIIGNVDMGMCTVLTSSHLSAAFETVDHGIFLRRLNFLYGVDGVPLNWFNSYFNDRDHRVCVHEALSPPRVITCGVPQGSVLGARLYIESKAKLTQQKISDCNSDQKKLFKIVDLLLGRNKTTISPEYSDPATLASTINTFFIDKIDKIRTEFPLLNFDLPPFSFVDMDCIMLVCTASLDHFDIVAVEELTKLHRVYILCIYRVYIVYICLF